MEAHGVGEILGGRQPRVLRLALEFVAYWGRHGPMVRRARPSLDGQVERTADSILLNIGEAFGEPSRGDKRRFFRYALRSAGEAEKALLGMATLGLLPQQEVQEGLRLLKDIRLDLHRLINSTP
jgi:four helix bundle protein